MKLFELPDKGDYEEMAKKHNELVELVKSTSTALGKMQEELDQMPSGYRNAPDIKNLKGRIERLEEKHGVDGCFNKNTVGNLLEHRDRIEKLEECCKNTVASGKALEERVNLGVAAREELRTSIQKLQFDVGEMKTEYGNLIRLLPSRVREICRATFTV